MARRCAASGCGLRRRGARRGARDRAPGRAGRPRPWPRSRPASRAATARVDSSSTAQLGESQRSPRRGAAGAVRSSSSSSRMRLIPDRLTPVLLGQPLYLAQRQHVAQRVPAAAAGGPAGRHQPQPVIRPQRLRVQAGQLGGDGDDVHGRCRRTGRTGCSCRHLRDRPAAASGRSCQPPLARCSRSSRGSSPGASPHGRHASAFLAWRVHVLRHLHLDGDQQIAVGPGRRTPLPRTRNVRPFGVPGGIRTLTGPRSASDSAGHPERPHLPGAGQGRAPPARDQRGPPGHRAGAHVPAST